MSHFVVGCLVDNKEVVEVQESLRRVLSKKKEGEKGIEITQEVVDSYTSNHFVRHMLKPYDENLRNEKYVEYNRNEIVKYGKEVLEDSETETELLEEIVRGSSEFENISDMMEKLNQAEDKDEVFYEAGKALLIDMYDFDQEGNAYYMYNPKAAWDWYVIGGRWNNMILKKDGSRVNHCKLNEINFEEMEEERLQDLSQGYEDAKTDSLTRMFLGVREEETKDEFLKRNTKGLPLTLHAMIHEDKWYEKGSMGWFGVSDETDESVRDFHEMVEKTIMNNLDTHSIIIVDCHI